MGTDFIPPSWEESIMNPLRKENEWLYKWFAVDDTRMNKPRRLFGIRFILFGRR